jgi:hypothetical protein
VARFAEFLAGSPLTEEQLAAYLVANPEWVRLEFKESKQVPTHGLRISVAALASTSGGDLFLGVKDDGTIEGCSFDPSALSDALEQKGAPVREDTQTDLVEVVGDPKQIPLANGNRVYWFEVPEHGWIVAALKDDRTLGLYDRPGANSKEVCGIAATDFFARPNRARLLRKAYEEAAALESSFQWVYQGEGKINDETTAPLRRIVNSKEWDQFARKVERAWVQSDEYLGLFLRLPSMYAAWGKLPYQKQQGDMLMTKSRMGDAVRRIREYLEREKILASAGKA